MTPKNKLHFQRFEFKYPMDERVAEHILETCLKNQLQWDPYVQDKPHHQYTVRSLYYDSPTWKCYYEKKDGLSYRTKLRARFYGANPHGNIFLELKRKKDAVILKDRIITPWADYKNNENLLYVPIVDGRPEVLNEIFVKQKQYTLRPKFLVQYERQALVGKFEDRLRVTFDRHLSYAPTDRLDYSEPLTPFNDRLVIMELKFNNSLPVWFKYIIEKHNLKPSSFSKYCELLEACYSTKSMLS